MSAISFVEHVSKTNTYIILVWHVSNTLKPCRIKNLYTFMSKLHYLSKRPKNCMLGTMEPCIARIFWHKRDVMLIYPKHLTNVLELSYTQIVRLLVYFIIHNQWMKIFVGPRENKWICSCSKIFSWLIYPHKTSKLKKKKLKLEKWPLYQKKNMKN